MAVSTQQRLRALGNTADALLAIDARQRIVFCNAAAATLLGYSEAELLRRPCYEVLAGECCGALWCFPGCRVQRLARRGRLPDAFDLRIRTREGTEIWVNVSTIVLPRKRAPLLVHTLRRADQKKRNEEAIQHMLETLGLQRPAAGNSRGPSAVVGDQSPICPKNALWALTRRELEMVFLLSRGLTTKQIARRVGVSVFTVRNHIQNALKKLKVSNRAQAVALAFANGIPS